MRRFVQPDVDDTLATIAERELPGDPTALSQLMSWNLHLAMRMPIGPPGTLLCSDVVFVEPPTP